MDPYSSNFVDPDPHQRIDQSTYLVENYYHRRRAEARRAPVHGRHHDHLEHMPRVRHPIAGH